MYSSQCVRPWIIKREGVWFSPSMRLSGVVDASQSLGLYLPRKKFCIEQQGPVPSKTPNTGIHYESASQGDGDGFAPVEPPAPQTCQPCLLPRREEGELVVSYRNLPRAPPRAESSIFLTSKTCFFIFVTFWKSRGDLKIDESDLRWYFGRCSNATVQSEALKLHQGSAISTVWPC